MATLTMTFAGTRVTSACGGAAARRGVLCLLAVVNAATGAFAQESPNPNRTLGPIYAPTMSPGNMFRPPGYIASPSGARPGQWILITAFSWVNTWNVKSDHYMIDGEWMELSVRLSRLLTRRLEAGLYVPLLGRTGGFADRGIESFHNSFGFGNQRRQEYPRDRTVIDIRTKEGNRFCRSGDHWDLADMALFAAYTLTSGGPVMPSVHAVATVTIPTGDEREFSGWGDPVYGTGWLLTKRWGHSPLLLFSGASVTYSSRNRMFGVPVHHTQYSFLAGCEFQQTPRLSWIVQHLTTTAVARDYYDFSKNTYELNVGVRLRTGGSGIWEFSFQENLFNFNNSADVGVHLAYRHTF